MSDFNHEEWRRNCEATENIPSLTKRELEEYLRYFTRDELKNQLAFQHQNRRDTCKDRIALLRGEINHRRARKPSWVAIAALLVALAGFFGLQKYILPSAKQTEARPTPTPMQSPTPTPQLSPTATTQ